MRLARHAQRLAEGSRSSDADAAQLAKPLPHFILCRLLRQQELWHHGWPLLLAQLLPGLPCNSTLLLQTLLLLHPALALLYKQHCEHGSHASAQRVPTEQDRQAGACLRGSPERSTDRRQHVAGGCKEATMHIARHAAERDRLRHSVQHSSVVAQLHGLGVWQKVVSG